MTLIVNLFSGPGAGKSTTASELFSILKKRHINCENVFEFAKELTWSKRHNDLKCQPYIFGEQVRRVSTLLGQVDVIITDSPILLSAIYSNPDYPPSFDKAAIDTFKMWYVRYPTLNFFLNRKKPYNPIGRNQTEEESKEIDVKIKNLLKDNQIHFIEEDADENIANRITAYIDYKLIPQSSRYTME